MFLTNPSNKKPMRSKEEIERAYNLMLGVVIPASKESPDEATMFAIAAMLDVLCWLLRHDHPTNFGELLAVAERKLAMLDEEEAALRERVNMALRYPFN
jgi:hypothetical protein